MQVTNLFGVMEVSGMGSKWIFELQQLPRSTDAAEIGYPAHQRSSASPEQTVKVRGPGHCAIPGLGCMHRGPSTQAGGVIVRFQESWQVV